MGKNQPYIHWKENPVSQARYSRRLVAFWDILGWRNKIETAGHDPSTVGALRNIVGHFSELKKSEMRSSMRVSTFSDNVVLTTNAVSDEILLTIVQLGMLQLIAAARGLWIRGGVTIGDIVHDDDVVFGPALNRAYKLESEVAKFPRIVIDTQSTEIKSVFKLFQTTRLKLPKQLIAKESDIVFIDPFNVEFISQLKWDEGNTELFLPHIAETLERELRMETHGKVFEKLAWLFDRVASRVNHPIRSVDIPRRTILHVP